MLLGLGFFWSVRGLMLGDDCLSEPLVDPTRSMGLAGVEVDGEKKEAGRSFFIFLDTGETVSGVVSCIGVKEDTGGRKTVRLFRRRLSDIAAGDGAKTDLAVRCGRISILQLVRA